MNLNALRGAHCFAPPAVDAVLMAIVNNVAIRIVVCRFPRALTYAYQASNTSTIVTIDVVLRQTGKILRSLQTMKPQARRVGFFKVLPFFVISVYACLHLYCRPDILFTN